MSMTFQGSPLSSLNPYLRVAVWFGTLSRGASVVWHQVYEIDERFD